MDRLFLKPEYLKILFDIFADYCPEAEIWAYGSRIKDEAHEGSDLDLVVRSFNNKEKDLYTLKELVNESNIPIITDIHEYDYLPVSFQNEIKKDYLVIWKNQPVI